LRKNDIMTDSTSFSRRQALMRTLFGAGAVGLRALATGLPASFLLNPRQALAQGAMCLNTAKAQYVIFATSASGDPMNANVPGTYVNGVVHSADPRMAPTSISLGGRSFQAGGPWGSLPQAVLNRTVFWHLMTNTPIHPKEGDVLKLMGASMSREMLPSLLAKTLAPCLNTIQPQPVSVGAVGPTEALSFNGAPLPTIPPLALKDTLTSPAGPITNLTALRDQTMNSIFGLYKTVATPQQRRFIDSYASTQGSVRALNQSLLSSLASITDNGVASQLTASIALIQMQVSPVIGIHIPFGGDNHADADLERESDETVSGVASIVSLMSQLQSAGLQDRVTFMTLNVFGRTLMTNGGQSATTGRTHNSNHQVSLTIGKGFKPGVVGGITRIGNDYGASGINSTTGVADANGDVRAIDSLGAFGQTALKAVGGDTTLVTRGKVIQSALV
jgi:hypothetical protein